MPGHGDDKERVEEEMKETLALLKELKLTEFSLHEEEKRNEFSFLKKGQRFMKNI